MISFSTAVLMSQIYWNGWLPYTCMLSTVQSEVVGLVSDNVILKTFPLSASGFL